MDECLRCPRVVDEDAADCPGCDMGFWETSPSRPGLPYVTIEPNMQVTPSEFPFTPEGLDGPITIREGVCVSVDEANFASNSGDLGQMEAAAALKTHRSDRHFLLMSLCRETYRLRTDPEMRVKFLKYARMHVAEYPFLRGGVKRDLMIDAEPGAPAFQLLATVLTEDGDFDGAVRICEEAKAFGFEDRTKSGYDGRIARIRKKQAQRPAS